MFSARVGKEYDCSLGPESEEHVLQQKKLDAAAMMPKQPNPDPEPAVDTDFDFSGDGRPYFFARGKASRVRGGRDGADIAAAQLRGDRPMDLALRNGIVRHVGPATSFGGLGESGGANRLVQPEACMQFRDFILRKVCEALAAPRRSGRDRAGDSEK